MTKNIRDRIGTGDRVKLRCGGTLIARMTTDLVLGCRPIKAWHDNGSYAMPHGSDFDVVEILPRPLTDTERLAKIAALARTTEPRAIESLLKGIEDIAAPPEHLDPGGM